MTYTHPSTLFTVDVDVWSWPEMIREIERRMISFGVRKRSVGSRWRGLSVELRLEVEGTAEQVHGFGRFLDSIAG